MSQQLGQVYKMSEDVCEIGYRRKEKLILHAEI